MTSALNNDFYRVLNELEEEGINWTSTINDDDPRVIFLREYVENIEKNSARKKADKKIARLKNLIYDKKISKHDIATKFNVTVSQLSGDMKKYGMDKDYVAFRKKLKLIYYCDLSKHIVKKFRNKTECKTVLKMGDKLLNSLLNHKIPRGGLFLFNYEYWLKNKEDIMKRLDQYDYATFTLKRDFNLTGFMIGVRPQYVFKTTHIGGEDFEQINTNMNVTLKEADISKLIGSKKTVVVIYEAQHKMDCYNYPDEIALLNRVVEY